jgi:hypothetical protein
MLVMTGIGREDVGTLGLGLICLVIVGSVSTLHPHYTAVTLTG